MENELSAPGTGIMVNDIGQITQGGGAYDTAGNVMAGYNVSKMTADTFNDRIKSIENRKIDQTEASGNRIEAIKQARADFLNAQGRTQEIYDFEEEEKEKQKNKTKTFLSKIFKRKKTTEPFPNATAKKEYVDAAKAGIKKAKITTTNDGGEKTSFAPKYDEADARRESYRGKKDGGRIGYFFGGLAARGMKR